MTTYSNVTAGPVVIDDDGHMLAGGDVADLAYTVQVAQAVACGALVDLDVLRGDQRAAAYVEDTEPKEND